ncbi:hypothetical protein VTN02DRAFT_212 [Thermoascus thermophilus]
MMPDPRAPKLMCTPETLQTVGSPVQVGQPLRHGVESMTYSAVWGAEKRSTEGCGEASGAGQKWSGAERVRRRCPGDIPAEVRRSTSFAALLGSIDPLIVYCLAQKRSKPVPLSSLDRTVPDASCSLGLALGVQLGRSSESQQAMTTCGTVRGVAWVALIQHVRIHSIGVIPAQVTSPSSPSSWSTDAVLPLLNSAHNARRNALQSGGSSPIAG